MTKEEQYKLWLERISAEVETDFAEDMNFHLMPGGRMDFTQEEAQQMANIIGTVYTWAHRVHCEACAGKI